MRYHTRLCFLCVLMPLLAVHPTIIADETEVLDLDTEEAKQEDVLVADETVESIAEEPIPVADEEVPVVAENVEVPEAAASIQDDEQEAAASAEMAGATAEVQENNTANEATPPGVLNEPPAPVQTGPFIDLFGPTLLSLEMLDETHAQLQAQYTSDALRGKKFVGVYFSADWW